MKSKLYNVYFSFIKDREVIYITYTVNTYSRQEAIEIARCVIAEKLGIKPYDLAYRHIEEITTNETRT